MAWARFGHPQRLQRLRAYQAANGSGFQPRFGSSCPRVSLRLLEEKQASNTVTKADSTQPQNTSTTPIIRRCFLNMPRLPKKMTASQTPISVEWNAMVDYLASLRPIDAPGTTTTHTPFGVSRAANKQRGASIFPGTFEMTGCDENGDVVTYIVFGYKKES